MVSLGYKNNAMAPKLYQGTLGGIKREIRGLPLRDVALEVQW